MYENTTKYRGLEGNKYIGTKAMFDNGGLVPSRKCYCANEYCLPSGGLNISSCKFGAPAVVTMPHFYLADPSYSMNITGMLPDKEKHELTLILESVSTFYVKYYYECNKVCEEYYMKEILKTSGFPLMVRAQLQLNILIEPVADMR